MLANIQLRVPAPNFSPENVTRQDVWLVSVQSFVQIALKCSIEV